MGMVTVARLADFEDTERRIFEVEGVEIGVFKLADGFVAYLNRCPHLGGPVCQGLIMPRVEEVVAPDRTSKGMAFSETRRNVICPWHGYEYDIATGQHQGGSSFRLKKLELSIEGEEIRIAVPERARAI